MIFRGPALVCERKTHNFRALQKLPAFGETFTAIKKPVVIKTLQRSPLSLTLVGPEIKESSVKKWDLRAKAMFLKA